MTSSTTTAAITGSWTTTGALPAAGSWSGQHDGAVLLADGTVLLAGGADASSAALAQAARYDPATGRWTATAAPRTPRRLHTATRLANGKVLVAGGTSVGTQFPPPGLAAAELYDPPTGTWTATGGLRTPRFGHSAVLLPDSSVLVAGGTGLRSGQSVTALRSAERYRPDTGTWTELAPMTDARTGHPAVVLANGRVLVIGGSIPTARDTDAALAFCELYDPATNAWTPTGNLLAPRSRHQAVLVSTTSVLVTGGSAPGAAGDGTFDPFSRASAELYNQNSGTWSAAAAMPAGRGLHRTVPLGSGKVLVVGGTDSVRNAVGYESALVYDATANTWSAAAGLATGRWAFAATALSNARVLVTGGVTRTGLAAASGEGAELTASTEVFTLTGTGTP
jgi:N-acetylneuraminic acid mutarotase